MLIQSVYTHIDGDCNNKSCEQWWLYFLCCNLTNLQNIPATAFEAYKEFETPAQTYAKCW